MISGGVSNSLTASGHSCGSAAAPSIVLASAEPMKSDFFIHNSYETLVGKAADNNGALVEEYHNIISFFSCSQAVVRFASKTVNVRSRSRPR
jgi:hypothetical protein